MKINIKILKLIFYNIKNYLLFDISLNNKYLIILFYLKILYQLIFIFKNNILYYNKR